MQAKSYCELRIAVKIQGHCILDTVQVFHQRSKRHILLSTWNSLACDMLIHFFL